MVDQETSGATPYQVSDLLVIPFRIGLCSYNFSFLRVHGVLNILATDARKILAKMYPSCSAFQDVSNHFSRSMSKIPNSLVNVSLHGRTQRDCKKKCTFVPVDEFTRFLTLELRKCNAAMSEFNDILLFLGKPMLSSSSYPPASAFDSNALPNGLNDTSTNHRHEHLHEHTLKHNHQLSQKSSSQSLGQYFRPGRLHFVKWLVLFSRPALFQLPLSLL